VAGSALLIKYYSGDQIERNEMGEARSTYGERSGSYRVLVGKREGKTPLGRPRRRCYDNIKMDFQECGGGMDVLTPIERETLQVFFTHFTDAQCVHLW
jgi:hypothetical protein